MPDVGAGTPMVVSYEGGARFGAAVRGHHVLMDQPLRAGGEDLAPTPLELLGTALGGCIALYVQRFCVARGLPHDGLRVEVRPESGTGRIERFDVRVIVPGSLPAHQAMLLERAARSCPVHHTLAHGAAIAIVVEHPEPAGEGRGRLDFTAAG